MLGEGGGLAMQFSFGHMTMTEAAADHCQVFNSGHFSQLKKRYLKLVCNICKIKVIMRQIAQRHKVDTSSETPIHKLTMSGS